MGTNTSVSPGPVAPSLETTLAAVRLPRSTQRTFAFFQPTTQTFYGVVLLGTQ